MAGETDGASLLGECLKRQGVEYMFGVVGIPIVEVAYGAQLAGVNYVGMRNEQSVCADHASSIITIIILHYYVGKLRGICDWIFDKEVMHFSLCQCVIDTISCLCKIHCFSTLMCCLLQSQHVL